MSLTVSSALWPGNRPAIIPYFSKSQKQIRPKKSKQHRCVQNMMQILVKATKYVVYDDTVVKKVSYPTVVYVVQLVFHLITNNQNCKILGHLTPNSIVLYCNIFLNLDLKHKSLGCQGFCNDVLKI